MAEDVGKASSVAVEKGKQSTQRKGGNAEASAAAAKRKLRTVAVPDASHSLSALAQSAAFYDVQRALSSAADSSSGPAVLPGISQSARKVAKRDIAKDLTSLAHKSVTALDPTLKQVFCTQCGTALIPGLTSKTRIRPSGPHQRVVLETCTGCEHRRKAAAAPVDAKNGSGLAAARRLRKERARARLRTVNGKDKQNTDGDPGKQRQAPP
ncbi:hypothetical protein OC842_002561 [Tilletia horrida]|uniref:Rpr2-domain-containing protein n=1 Tax=Tilletia horrida TaxID=155126 RepID=A0AAN6JS29_9BASI|nr:hypothetical protein OC842_002561 [Tilletia horrida]